VLTGEAVCQGKEVPIAHRKLNARAAEGGRISETSLFSLTGSEWLPAENADSFRSPFPICHIRHPSWLTEVIRVPNT